MQDVFVVTLHPFSDIPSVIRKYELVEMTPAGRCRVRQRGVIVTIAGSSTTRFFFTEQALRDHLVNDFKEKIERRRRSIDEMEKIIAGGPLPIEMIEAKAKRLMGGITCEQP